MLVLVPLSFNAAPHFTFTEGMLRLDPDAIPCAGTALCWRTIPGCTRCATASSSALRPRPSPRSWAPWRLSGLQARICPGRGVVTSLLISPLITPIIISAARHGILFRRYWLAQTHAGLIFGHAALCTPFVIITVTATLSNYNLNLNRAAASLGAHPVTTFLHVQLPLIAPGVISGALFAFVISLDEVIVVTFVAAWISAPFRGGCGLAFRSISTRKFWRSPPC